MAYFVACCQTIVAKLDKLLVLLEKKVVCIFVQGE